MRIISDGTCVGTKVFQGDVEVHQVSRITFEADARHLNRGLHATIETVMPKVEVVVPDENCTIVARCPYCKRQSEPENHET